MPPIQWYGLTAWAFAIATFALLVSGGCILLIIGKIVPLLNETREQVQDLGDLAANTVGRASETMELVELRVSQAMGQATHAGTAASQQAVGVGSLLAGVYLASRVGGLLRQQFGALKGKGRRRAKRR